MGRPSYHGPIETIGDSCQADYFVRLTCEQCRTSTEMHPYKLISAKRTLTTARLGTPLPGFYCKAGRHSARVIVTCTHRRPGEF